MRLVLAILAFATGSTVRATAGDAPPPSGARPPVIVASPPSPPYGPSSDPLSPVIRPTTGPGASAPAPSAFLVGEFALGDDPVVDGDTFRLPAGAPARSVRIQCVDAEEVWHMGAERDRAAAAEDFDRYSKAKRGESPTPVKFATPAGEAAKTFAKEFLKGVTSIRLERDEVGRDFDGHGRLLAHVFVVKDGKDVLFADALVRAGLSPYFVKYGRSRRFDDRLKAAQAEARAAGRGIFGDGVRHYPDYGERFRWWEARAKQVDAWRADVKGAADPSAYVELGVATDPARMATLLGRTVTVFGALDRVDGTGTPKRILLVDKPHQPFSVVIFDGAVWGGIDLAPIGASFVRVTGTLSEYRGRAQLLIDDSNAISTK